MKSILYIGNQLTKHGYSPTSVDTLTPLLQKEGFKIYAGSSFKNIGLRFLHMIYLVFIYRKKVDVVMIDTYSTKAFWYALLVSQFCRLLNKKYVSYLHGGKLENRLNHSPFLSKLIFRNSCCNVAPSYFLQHLFCQHGFQKTIVIPNNIFIQNYSFLKKENFSPNLLWVRSMAAIYQPKMAIDVLVELKKVYPEATLTMVGPEKDVTIASLKQYATENNVEVVFTGRLSKQEWCALAKTHDVFINTTSIDNTPITLIEAMALGMPIVSTNVGGIPFMVENHKHVKLVLPNQVIEFVKAIVEFIDNPDKTITMVYNARNLAETMDWNEVKHLWIDLIKD
ncbi:MAG: glycosyltransferase family 4 protein [Flavobacteriales bacterium]|nr:glycosyltransferase family 4 protein [Flavobacteriales bacterium]